MAPELSTKTAFKKLYTEYYSILINFAFAKTADWDLSREIVQHTFVKIWMRREKTEINTSIRSYLFMMVRNGIIDHYRHRERYADHVELKDVRYEESQDQAEEELILFRHVIKQALMEMKPKRREIFELSKFEGLTYAEIAEHLHISERSVEDNMAKAIAQIRELLGRYRDQL